MIRPYHSHNITFNVYCNKDEWYLSIVWDWNLVVWKMTNFELQIFYLKQCAQLMSYNFKWPFKVTMSRLSRNKQLQEIWNWKKNYLFFGLVGLSMTRFYHSCILVDSYNETDIFTIGSFHLALLEYN